MIKAQLQNKIKEALKAGDQAKTSTYRLLLAALNNEQIAKQHELSEDEELAVVKRQLKQREEAAAAYESAGRSESAQKEKKEAQILKEFLPEQLDERLIGELVNQVIDELGSRDFGVLMKHAMVKVGGRADGSLVARVVKEKLSA